MKLTIHRGSNQIGGCITEYTINGWRLFVDYGEQLSAISLSEKSPEIEGLTYGDISKSALLITHYHSDHVGNITHLPQKLPIYMGYLACEVLATYAEHIGYVNEKYKQLAYRITTVKQFKPGRAFEFGDFRIMPITLDHSAFDAYAFKIEAKGLKGISHRRFQNSWFQK